MPTIKVEMVVTRLRELTHETISVRIILLQGRNGCYPIKGIDTEIKTFLSFFRMIRRNGCYPIKGIDTAKIKPYGQAAAM